MGDNVLVTVDCPNHGEVLTSGLWNFFLTNHRTDSELQRGGDRSIHAHQLVVEVFLPLERLVHHSWAALEPGNQAQHQSGNYLDSLLEFMYRGRVTVAKDRLNCLGQLARDLGFQLLADAVECAGSRNGSRISTNQELDQLDSNAGDADGKINAGDSKGDSGPEEAEPVQRSRRYSTRKIATKSATYNAGADPKLYHCPHCPYESPKYANYLNHLRSTHQVNVRGKAVQKRFKCSECNYAHVFQSALKRHIKIKHSDKLFKCNQCPFASNIRSRLSAHVSRCHLTVRSERAEKSPAANRATSGGRSTKIRHCPYCDYETPKVGNYHSHLRSIHKVTSRGEPVVKKYKLKDQSTSGTTSTTPTKDSNTNNNFRCPLCAFASSTWSKLNDHVNLTHTLDALDGSVHGGDGNSSVDGTGEPRRPSATENGDKDAPKTYRCVHCEYETLKVGNYHNHLRSIHRITAKGQPAIKKYKCDECDYAHVFQSAVKRHQQVKHSKEKPFKCQQCPFASNSRGQLNAHHNRVHLGLKKVPPGPKGKHHICDVCGRFFTGRDSLKAHSKKFHDQGAAIFKCELCDYTSNSKRDVSIVHRNLAHSNDKPHPFTCSTCGHRSPTRYDMERHRLTHTGERPYKCDICQKAFSQRGHLNVHKKRQHPGDDQPRFACDVTLSTDYTHLSAPST